jgi:deoxyribonuclease-4
MFGAHLSIAGGLHRALEEAGRLKLDCVQVFTKNPQQWRSGPVTAAALRAWNEALAALGWTGAAGRGRVVSHNTYLINLASPQHAVWARSIAAQRAELERCEALGIGFCVTHPGAHLGPAPPAGRPHALGAPPSDAELAGLRRVAAALDSIHADLAGYRTLTLLETTTGAGSCLGYDFAHLAFIRSAVREPQRVAFCLDTCHIVAAGYDMSTDARARDVLDRFDSVCGLEALKVVHVNDSRGAPGSRLDRHAHIGEGRCGRSCFRAVVNCPSLRSVPKILETPKGQSPGGSPWDLINLRRLKRLMGPPMASR